LVTKLIGHVMFVDVDTLSMVDEKENKSII
jgi:hypothetical protein